MNLRQKCVLLVRMSFLTIREHKSSYPETQSLHGIHVRWRLFSIDPLCGVLCKISKPVLKQTPVWVRLIKC